MTAVPDYPGARIVIDVPFDSEPKVADDGGLAPYLVSAVLNRLLDAEETEWEVTPAETEDE